MKCKNLIVLFATVIVICQQGMAQDINALQLTGLYAGTYLHPGIKLEKKVNVAFADIDINLGTGGGSIGKYLTKNADGAYYFDKAKLGYFTKEQNDVFVNNRINTIGFAIKVKDFHLMVGHSLKTKVNAQYSTDLLELITRGNGKYIGKTLDIGPNLNMINYHDLQLGAQKTFGKLTVGARINLMYGISAVNTERSKISFTTEENNYNLKVDTDFLMHSSSVFEYNGIDSTTTDVSFNSFADLFKNNSGFGFEIGASYELSDKITLTAGMTDIGKITWDKNPNSYSSKGTYTYSGVDIIPLVENENLSYDIEDTLRNILQIKEVGGDFSTTLSPNFLVSGTYKLGSKWSFMGLISSNGGFKLRRNQLAIAAVRKVSIFDLGLQYMMSDDNDFDNIGLNIRLNAGPFKFYTGVESIFSFTDPINSNYASAKVGFGLRF
jgi:hypothetical protein